MRLDARHWATLSSLIDEWLELPSGAREKWIDSLGPEHVDILPILRELLHRAAKAEAKGFLSQLPRFDDDATELGPNTLVGPYRLIRELGTGGMGVVWLAERADGSLKRSVALKLPIDLLPYRSLGKRFAQERDILAQLAHPNIARLYDAGVTAEGQPYLALEYVEGESITTYCDRKRLSVDARLCLFADVLFAVQHAHSRLIVHRDLKPANILVTSNGEVRLLDFGIAKLLTEGEGRETELTRIGGRALTPDYASPEQITGDAISTASDVYSLGVVLYELLTGERPYRLKRSTVGTLEEAIGGAEIVPPSRSLKQEAQAEPRGSSLGRLTRLLRGDLDTIALKALRKLPQDRYPTVDAFAQDLERYRSGEPVIARNVSAWYRTRKFVLRNKLAVASAAAVVISLGIGLGAALWQAHVAVLEKQRADAQAATTRAINEFLEKDLLAQASPGTQAGPQKKPDPDLKVRTALDRAAASLGGRFANQPNVEASVRHTIASTYKDLGLYSEAERQEERAFALRRGSLGDEHADTLQSMVELVWLYKEKGEFAKAEDFLVRIVEARRSKLGEQHPDTLSAIARLAWLYEEQGKYQQAEGLFSKSLEAQSRILGAENPQTLDSMAGLAMVYVDQAKYSRAESLYNRLIATQRRVLGEEHPDTLSSIQNFVDVYTKQGRYADAEALDRSVLQIRQRILGDEHSDTLISMANLAMAYWNEGKYEAAENLFAKVLQVQRRVLGEEHPDVLIIMNNLALLYMRRGGYEQAERFMTKSLESRRRMSGDEHPRTLRSLTNLGVLYQREGRYAESDRLLNKALAASRRTLGERHPQTLDIMSNLAGLYRAQGNQTQAFSLWTKVLEERRSAFGDEHPATLACMNELALLYRDQGRYQLARPLLTKVVETRRRVLGPQHPDTAVAMASLGGVLFLEGECAPAESLLREALANQQKTIPDFWETYLSQSLLGATLTGRKAYGEAEHLLLAAYQGLTQRESAIPFDRRVVLQDARERIEKLYTDWQRPEMAQQWARERAVPNVR